MSVFLNSKMVSVYEDKTPVYKRQDCQVKLEGDEIVVDYKDERGIVLYKGKEKGQGHYLLKCPEKQGEASLHRFSEAEILDGYWREEGYEGFWRIHLA